jgi:hypothetical protein
MQVTFEWRMYQYSVMLLINFKLSYLKKEAYIMGKSKDVKKDTKKKPAKSAKEKKEAKKLKKAGL